VDQALRLKVTDARDALVNVLLDIIKFLRSQYSSGSQSPVCLSCPVLFP
jgi:hypothetical protein